MEISSFASHLIEGARRELHLTPKPGLVDRLDNGSHHDLNMQNMTRSIDILSIYADELCASLCAGEPLSAQVALGIRAETRMIDLLGTNTHKGFIFLAGLAVVARYQYPESSLRDGIRQVARELFADTRDEESHGERARKSYAVSGIVGEALNGFPSLFDGGLQAYTRTFTLTGEEEAATFAMMAQLMQTVEDTTAIHRCGIVGLARLRKDGAELQRKMEAGEDYIGFLLSMNKEYKQMRLTMGGVADMLGLGLGIISYEKSRGNTPLLEHSRI